jgi:hypothetical protein
MKGGSIVLDGGPSSAGLEWSWHVPRSSARSAGLVGGTNGSTGEAEEIRRLGG